MSTIYTFLQKYSKVIIFGLFISTMTLGGYKYHQAQVRITELSKEKRVLTNQVKSIAKRMSNMETKKLARLIR